MTLVPLLLAATMAAQTTTIRHTEENQTVWRVSADLVARHNPAGVMVFAGLSHRWSLDGGSPSLALRHAEVGLRLGANPAYAQGAVYGEWAPAPFLVLRGQYDLFGYFGQLGSLLSFPRADSNFSPDVISAREGDESAGFGHRLQASITLRARAKWLFARSQTDIAGYFVEGDGPFTYEWELDTLIDRADLVVTNRTNLSVAVLETDDDTLLLIGPVYEVSHSKGADLTRHRLSAGLFGTMPSGWGFLEAPRVYLQVGGVLDGPVRDGELFMVAGIGSDFYFGGGR